MNKIIWSVGVLLALLWTATCAGGYAMLGWASDTAQRGTEWNGGLEPEWQYWVEWSLRLIEGMGGFIFGIVWAFGAVFILAATWIFSAVLRRFLPKIQASAS